MARRAIEVGRAVLFSPSTHQELWLTTLITLSQPQQQQQQFTNFGQLSVDSLLSHLSSGHVWVDCGRDMHMEFALTYKREPLPYQLLKTLITSILSAPAWEQLNLQPSWVPGPEDELGIARISLNHRTGDGSVHLKTIHRVFSGVPAADMKPLEGIPRFSFESVRLSMDILDSKEQVRTSGAKHPKTSTKRGDISASQNGSLGGKATEGQLSGYSSLATGTRTVCPERGVARHTVDGQDADRKRKRALSTDDISMSPALALSSDLYGCNAVPNLAGFGKLIDGALRLAICGFIKAANGIKVKASSIHSGLAELIPELWSPGFSSSMSTRAQLLPVISRSLIHSADAKATSLSLKGKMVTLETVSLRDEPKNCAHQPHTPGFGSGGSASPVACRLWMHLRRNLCKNVNSVSSFVALNPPTTGLLGSGEPILERTEQRSEGVEALSSHELGDVHRTRRLRVTPGGIEDDLLLLDTTLKV